MIANLNVSDDRISEFCRKWQVREFSFFGSVLREDFRPDSDIDVLVTFDGPSPALEDWLDMLDELRELFGREVDLVERDRLRNPFRRQQILQTRQVVYAA